MRIFCNVSGGPARIHWIAQVPFERAAAIADWAESRGHALSGTRAYADEPYPAIEDIDTLVVLGGPMSVHDTAELPWLAKEKEFLRSVLDAGKRILGLCLGAQLLAEALGGTVRRNEFKEIGWHTVQLTPAAESHPWFVGLPREITAFQWHGDTFSIPPGGTHLATSPACANQAFVFGERALGLQFHLEYTEESIRDIMAACPEELAEPGPYIRPAEEMLAHPERIKRSNELLFNLLDRVGGSEKKAPPSVERGARSI